MSEQAKITDFQPDKANANVGTQHGRRVLDHSIGKLGLGRSILVDKHGNVISGNKAQEVALDLGLEDAIVVKTRGDKMVVVQREDLDLYEDETARQLAYADNRAGEMGLDWNIEQIVADLDTGLDLDGIFAKDELSDMLEGFADGLLGEEPPEPQIDKAEELREKWGVELGQIWHIPSKTGDGEHRIICGDCTDAEVVERVMGGEKAEMVWTDPPYGVAVGDKNKFLNSIARSNRIEENLDGDTLDESALCQMLHSAFANAVAVCEPGGAWYVAAPPGPLHVLFGLELKALEIWRQTIQWVKNNATFSPMGVDYHWQAEPLFYGWLPGAGHRYYGGRKQTTVWEIDRPVASPEHPTMKPVELVERGIENSSQATQLVYDPFLGSGTTLVACERLGRFGRGCEISPGYTAVSLQRLADMGLQPERVT